MSNYCPKHNYRGAFTLLEVLIVVAVIAILAAVIMPNTSTSYHDQLCAAANIVAAELSYARSLAETNGSKYMVTLDIPTNRLLLKHTGTSAALNQLPKNVFNSDLDTAETHIVDIDELSSIQNVAIHRVAIFRDSLIATTNVEFGPLGETTAQYPTLIWLATGPADERLYILISVDPISGLASVGKTTGRSPIPLIAEQSKLRDVSGAAPTLPSGS